MSNQLANTFSTTRDEWQKNCQQKLETFDSIERTEFTNFVNANNKEISTMRTSVPLRDEIEANHTMSQELVMCMESSVRSNESSVIKNNNRFFNDDMIIRFNEPSSCRRYQ